MNPKIIAPEDLTLYALQLLTPEETAEIVTHLEHNEAARKEVALIQGDLAMYAMTSDLHSPPALTRERLLRRVAKEAKLVPISRTEAPAAAAAAGPEYGHAEPMLVSRRGLHLEDDAPVRRSTPVFAWAGWALAASLAAAAGLEFHQRQVLQNSLDAQNAQITQLTVRAGRSDAILATLTNPAAMEVALHLPATGAPVPPQPQAHAAYVAETGSLLFVASHLAPLPPYKTYELWVIPDGHDPLPAGTFKPDERGYANVILPDLPRGIAAKTFGVTIEDEGGSKSPTLPIILAGL